MAEQKPLVAINGQAVVLPAGDTLAGVAAGGGSAQSEIVLDFGTAAIPARTFTFAHAGAAITQKVLMQASAKMPDGMESDELEMDGLTCAAFVSAQNTITAVIRAAPGPVAGRRTFTYLIG